MFFPCYSGTVATLPNTTTRNSACVYCTSVQSVVKPAGCGKAACGDEDGQFHTRLGRWTAAVIVVTFGRRSRPQNCHKHRERLTLRRLRSRPRPSFVVDCRVDVGQSSVRQSSLSVVCRRRFRQQLGVQLVYARRLNCEEKYGHVL